MRLALTLALLLAAPAAHAAGISGSIFGSTGAPMYPCDIDVFDRNSGAPVAVTGDSTLPNGNYAVTLPNGRYVVKFRPPIGQHWFQLDELDVRVNNNTVVMHRVLPRGQYLSGRVLGPDGLGVAGANIRFKDAAGNAPNDVQDDGADANGVFQTLVEPGVWNIEIIPPLASHRVPVQLPATDLLSADVAVGVVSVEAGFIVTATVTDAGFFPVLDSKLQARTAPNGSKLYTPLNTTDATGTARAVLPAGVYDFAIIPPPFQPYGTVTARSVVLGADVTLPNFALPAGHTLSAHVVSPSLVGVANVDIDVDSLPAANPRRLETPGDATDGAGNVSVLVPAWKYRVTFNPPVATRLQSMRLDSVQVAGATALGNVVLPQGHWVDVNVVAEGSALPVAGCNLDFQRVATGDLLITIDDVTGATGHTRVVTGQELYRLRVIPPTAGFDTLVVENFRSLGDTTITLALHSPFAGVSPATPRGTLALSPPWPSPSRGAVNVSFSGASGRVELVAMDLNGRRLATLFSGEALGTHSVRWDGSGPGGSPLPAGIYWLRLSSERDGSVSRRVALVR